MAPIIMHDHEGQDVVTDEIAVLAAPRAWHAAGVVPVEMPTSADVQIQRAAVGLPAMRTQQHVVLVCTCGEIRLVALDASQVLGSRLRDYDELVAAASLLSQNAEYDRGMAELIADTAGAIPGMPLDERAAQVLAEIRKRATKL